MSFSELLKIGEEKLILRTDRGSPNMATDVRISLRLIGVVFSPGWIARQTTTPVRTDFFEH